MEASLYVSELGCEHRHRSDQKGCEYQVAWQINPHMRVGSTVFDRARAQHDAFCAALSKQVNVIRMPFVHGRFDSVFIKDNAVLIESNGHRRALLAQPRHRQRQGEQLERSRALSSAGFEIVSNTKSHFEGGDRVDALNFALNTVEIGDTVFIGGKSLFVEEALRHMGRQPRHVDLSEFTASGGSASCLVSRLHERTALQ